MMIKSYKFIFLFFLFFRLLIIESQTKSTVIKIIDGKKYYIHKIEKKESLFAIIKLYNSNTEEIYKLNPEIKIIYKVGQEIKIPYDVNNLSLKKEKIIGAEKIDTNKFFTHLIAKGETIFSLTKKFNLSEIQLKKYNKNIEYELIEGQQIIYGIKERYNKIEHFKNELILTSDKKQANNLFVNKTVLRLKKKTYNIALMLPFNLSLINSLDLIKIIESKNSFPLSSALALDFYLGFKNVIDTLLDEEFNINLQVYDFNDSDSLKVVSFINDSSFKNLDFIFCQMNATMTKIISDKAQELSLPVVSTLLNQTKILHNNSFISKTNPSRFTLLENLADYCIDSLNKAKANIAILIESDKNKKEVAYANSFKKYYNKKIKSNTDSIRLIHKTSEINTFSDYDPRTVIVTFSLKETFISDLIRQLATQKSKIVLCGMEELRKIENIDHEYLSKLNYTFTYQNDITNTQQDKQLIKKYIKSQNVLPSEFYFMGYYIASYYLNNLKKNGPEFITKLDLYPMETNFMRFKFNRPDTMTGFENRGGYIFKYNNFKLERTGWR